MDRIDKFLRRLNQDERAQVEILISRLLTGDWVGLDIKKLKAYDLLRLRQGKIRIIFTEKSRGVIMIIHIGRRNDNTYKF